ncbi:BMP family lipoprotein [Candidatus Cryosericum septentrionale]|jgi:basic membrane protein A|uniref:BMP family ABC transporter substrate-binding protein n=1 Tax=Candidatus Cryosericum septentrionale TaxID=2290913 RepID=A0A398DQQ2_9BACT|nr:BMP family ABC transporter substrate-binding protein [Candidatus Cryosericum septentrionale]RIE16349.1 BMP family ABC transporter substrate-binding protein [Candidatus Cryosericum septentrionale]
MRRLLSVVLILALAASVFTGCKKATPVVNEIKIGLVTDVGGRGDQSFNDSALRGLEIWAAKKSFVKGGGYIDMSDADYAQSLADNAPDLTDKNIAPIPGITPVVLESKEQTDYVPNLTKLAEDEGCKMIIAVGFMLADATYQVAKDHPDVKFMLIDAVPSDATTFAPLPNLPNLVDYLFKEEQCGFLVGAIAGYATKANKIGYIGGIAVPAVQRYEAGFFAGIKTTNPTAYGTAGKNVADVYAGSFGDQPKGKLIAQTMIAQKCDILFHAAGATGNGMFEAIKEAGGPDKGLWGIGVDVDMGKNPNLYPAGTLTSAIKHVDFATWTAIKSVVDDTFKSEVVTLSLTDGGVGWAQDNVAKVLSADQITKINNLRQAIIDGTIVPPTDPKAVPAWTAPTGY